MIIGLNGRAGSGKDTVANYLVENHGFKRFAFADAVREAALAINPILHTNWFTAPNGILDVQLNEFRLAQAIEAQGWDKAKREIPEVRRLLQVIGTEVGRQILGEDCWVNIVRTQIFEQDAHAVITDLRFPNEAAFVTEYNGYVVKIVRPNNPDAIAATHASEQYEPEADWMLCNDDTLDELYWRVDRLWEVIQSDRIDYLGG